jgi:hypothetical protein
MSLFQHERQQSILTLKSRKSDGDHNDNVNSSMMFSACFSKAENTDSLRPSIVRPMPLIVSVAQLRRSRLIQC